jgi:hypothetical protein
MILCDGLHRSEAQNDDRCAGPTDLVKLQCACPTTSALYLPPPDVLLLFEALALSHVRYLRVPAWGFLGVTLLRDLADRLFSGIGQSTRLY